MPVLRKALLLFLVMLGVFGCGRGFQVLTLPQEITSWAFVDGNASTGINKDVTKTAGVPQTAVLNSKLYSIWSESNGTANQIRVAVYGGVGVWTNVDGNLSTGLNKSGVSSANNPLLVTFNSKLYAIWREANGAVTQVRVAVYNSNDSSPVWTFVDGNTANGINKDPTQNATLPRAKVLNSKLYLNWQETNAGVTQIRVVVYNGNDSAPTWSFVDGNQAVGINKSSSQAGTFPDFAVFNSKLYCVWDETSGGITQVRLAVYNGDDSNPSWSFVDGNGAIGLNKNPSQNAINPRATPFNSKLYAAWPEFNGGVRQIRVAVYGGDDSSPSWIFVDGNQATGLNKNTSQQATNPQLTVYNSKLYATWFENIAGVSQVRAAVYSGNDVSPVWTFVDGNASTGLNNSTGQSVTDPQLTTFGSGLYLMWAENTSSGATQIRAAVALCNGLSTTGVPNTNW